VRENTLYCGGGEKVRSFIRVEGGGGVEKSNITSLSVEVGRKLAVSGSTITGWEEGRFCTCRKEDLCVRHVLAFGTSRRGDKGRGKLADVPCSLWL